MNDQRITDWIATVTVTAPAHMSCYLIYGDMGGVSDEEIQAVDAHLEGLDVIDVARDADGNCLEPSFTWSFGDCGGTARGGDVLDYIARKRHL